MSGFSDRGRSMLPAWLDDEHTAAVYHRPRREGAHADFPPWVSDQVRSALAGRDITQLWRHQALAAQAVFEGHHTALATGTASGKTLAYLLPIVAAAEGRVGHTPPQRGDRARLRLGLPERHTALYLAPTKALAHDQVRVFESLRHPQLKVSALDGDSDRDERRFAREFADFVLSNPDMLHRSVLPAHQRWGRFLGALRYVVIDEAHRYKGVFGAQVAMVLRRLRRLCRHYGSDPTFVFASATISDAAAVGCALAGVDAVQVVADDSSPAPALDFVLRRPTPHLTHDAGALLARLAGQGQTLAFTTSRVQAEVIALRAKQEAPAGCRIAAYRGGYLSDDRRRLEALLQSGELNGVACTNALELGVDIAGMDAVVSVGFPGTLAALWQQVGRAGRSGRDALAVLVAREDPLDAYLVEHPELIFTRPVERTALFPDNPYVLGPHVAAAAQELPLTETDAAFFGEHMVAVAEQLTRQGVLRRRPAGWFWPHAQRAVDAIDLRSIQGKPCEVVDASTGAVIGQVDPAAADRTLYPEAIYVHQGEYWLVTEFDEVDRVATVVPAGGEYFTQPLSLSGVRILETECSRALGVGTLAYGTVELSNQVTAYLRRDAETGDVWDQSPLEMPVRTMTTKAVWWTLADDVVSALDLEPAELPGAVHGAEHAAIGLLPAIVPCDRWDIGGLSTVLHPDTGTLTVFVHDGSPGGSGFAAQGYQHAETWWTGVLQRLTECTCDSGCPACVVSPKCGSGNDPLDKRGAAELVRALTLGL